MKVCTKCGIEKPYCDFYKRGKSYKSHCKICTKEYYTLYYNQNKELHNSVMKEHYKINIERYKSKRQEYSKKNKEKNNERNKKYIKERRKKDPIYHLITNIRSRTYIFLKTKKLAKHNTTKELIGCTPEELKKHIESLFTEGMCWELLGKKIHIDHIIPLSSAKTEKDIYKLCNYRNLQPMWAEDNIKKSNKV